MSAVVQRPSVRSGLSGFRSRVFVRLGAGGWRRAARLGALACALAVSASLIGVPVLPDRADAVPAAASPAVCPVERPDAVSAALTARLCSKRIRVSSLLSETTEVWAEPGGAFTAEVQVEELLDPVDLAKAVVTGDAAHTLPRTAAYIHRRDGDYVLTLKANQPSLLDSVTAKLFATTGPAHHLDIDTSHGRTVHRQIWATDADGIDFPGAAQVFRIRRDVRPADQQRDRPRDHQPGRSLRASHRPLGTPALGHRKQNPLGS